MTAIATIVGRLTRDPETSTIQKNGEELSVTKFSVAVDDSFGKDSTTSFFDFVAWNGLGTNLAKYQGKGDQVCVVARPKQSRWEQDGHKRQKVEFIAEKIEFLGSRSKTEGDVPAAVVAESAPVSSAPAESTPAPVAETPATTEAPAAEAPAAAPAAQMEVPF